MAIDHERKLREKQGDIDLLHDKLRDTEARAGISMDETRALEEKYLRA